MKHRAIAKAGAINRAAINYGFSQIIPGKTTTHELDWLLNDFLKGRGAEASFNGYMQYPAHSCISINNEIVHTIPRKNHVIQTADLLTIDIGTYYDYYHADAADTRIVGGLGNAEDFALIAANWAIIRGMMSIVKDGLSLLELAATGKNIAIRYGVQIYNDLCGHGISKVVHEPPTIYHTTRDLDPDIIFSLSEQKLCEGQTICIEPVVTYGKPEAVMLDDGWTIVSKDGRNSSHMEHTIMVTKYGYEILS